MKKYSWFVVQPNVDSAYMLSLTWPCGQSSDLATTDKYFDRLLHKYNTKIEVKIKFMKTKNGKVINYSYIVPNNLGGFSSTLINGELTHQEHGLFVASLQPPLKHVKLIDTFEFEYIATWDFLFDGIDEDLYFHHDAIDWRNSVGLSQKAVTMNNKTGKNENTKLSIAFTKEDEYSNNIIEKEIFRRKALIDESDADLIKVLMSVSEQFIVKRSSTNEKTNIAGYPFFC